MYCYTCQIHHVYVCVMFLPSKKVYTKLDRYLLYIQLLFIYTYCHIIIVANQSYHVTRSVSQRASK